MPRTVGEVARLAGVSVRTLHHYDAPGLLVPSQRMPAGYRLYDRRDLERLQQILFFRELGFALEESVRILNDPAFDRREALLQQRRQLRERAARLEIMIRAADAALDAIDEGADMDEQQMFEIFGDTHTPELEQEARERWGGTKAWHESARRTSRHTRQDWETIKAESQSILQRLAELLGAGRAPDAAEVLDAAEAHRRHIERWFYPCPRALHRGLGELYVDDPRFAANLDRLRPGLAAFLRGALRTAALRTGS